ncbi:hypothetical protein D3C76_803450 [compost metagenome]
MGTGLTFGGPGDTGEILVARQLEGAEFESAVAGDDVGGAGLDVFIGKQWGKGCGFKHGHDRVPLVFVGGVGWADHFRQMSAHFSTDNGPLIVCCRITPGRLASKR